MSDAEPTTRISAFHAHVYYADAPERDRAAVLREAVSARFTVVMGRWHDKLVGPHPVSMYQIAFAADQFATLMPWLMLNRAGLTVLVHPETGRPRDDHLKHAAWLGRVLELDGSVLPEQD